LSSRRGKTGQLACVGIPCSNFTSHFSDRYLRTHRLDLKTQRCRKRARKTLFRCVRLARLVDCVRSRVISAFQFVVLRQTFHSRFPLSAVLEQETRALPILQFHHIGSGFRNPVARTRFSGQERDSRNSHHVRVRPNRNVPPLCSTFTSAEPSDQDIYIDLHGFPC